MDKLMRNLNRFIKTMHNADDDEISADNDIVLAKMLEVGATLDLATYCDFAMIDPESLNDAEVLMSIPDVILANTKRIQ